MKKLLKDGREKKGLKTREVAQLLHIDQALISKFENGLRFPTRTQVKQLAELFEIDYETLMISWLKEKILHEIGEDEFALKAILAVEEHLTQSVKTLPKRDSAMESILEEFDILKKKLDNYRNSDTKSSQP